MYRYMRQFLREYANRECKIPFTFCQFSKHSPSTGPMHVWHLIEDIFVFVTFIFDVFLQIVKFDSSSNTINVFKKLEITDC
jgi:hypothetical protein